MKFNGPARTFVFFFVLSHMLIYGVSAFLHLVGDAAERTKTPYWDWVIGGYKILGGIATLFAVIVLVAALAYWSFGRRPLSWRKFWDGDWS